MRSKPYIDANPDEQAMIAAMVKLDIGCGTSCRPGFEGIDRLFGCEAFPLSYSDGTLLLDDYADEIVASHILEHFSHRDTQAVVNEWVRVLKPGGLLRIAVPDFSKIVHAFSTGNPNNWPLLGYLMGAQGHPDNYHKHIFTEQNLSEYMVAAGLVDIYHWSENWSDCALYEVSLNLQGTKP